MAKIQLDFLIGSLTGDEAKKAELTGMLILASDFIGSGKVKGANKLVRITKANVPIHFFKTKSGQFIPINPLSNQVIKIPITTLPSAVELHEYCSDPQNLDLNKLHNKLMQFQTDETELVGGFNEKESQILVDLLKAPQGTRSDFTDLPSLKNKTEIKEELAKINDKVFDETALQKAIKERMDIIAKALKDESTEWDNKYSERTEYWKVEIQNKNENLKKHLKDVDKELEQDIKKVEKEIQKKMDQNFQNFIDGITKNIRKDEKPIEASIQDLEKTTAATKGTDGLSKIERSLRQLADQTETFRAAVAFAQKQVKTTILKEEDLQANLDVEIEAMKRKAEIEKDKVRSDSEAIEKRRDDDLKQVKEDRDVSAMRLTKFNEFKSEWAKEMLDGINKKMAIMLPPSLFGDESNANSYDLLVPTYIFQYDKQGELMSVVVPPIYLPENFKKVGKDSIAGTKKTVQYQLVVPGSRKLISEFLEDALMTRDIQSLLGNTPNLLDTPSSLRDTFFNSQSLMIDKLKVNKNGIKKANDRLTEVWTSG